jgi:hypothetical protein
MNYFQIATTLAIESVIQEWSPSAYPASMLKVYVCYYSSSSFSEFHLIMHTLLFNRILMRTKSTIVFLIDLNELPILEQTGAAIVVTCFHWAQREAKNVTVSKEHITICLVLMLMKLKQSVVLLATPSALTWYLIFAVCQWKWQIKCLLKSRQPRGEQLKEAVHQSLPKRNDQLVEVPVHH